LKQVIQLTLGKGIHMDTKSRGNTKLAALIFTAVCMSLHIAAGASTVKQVVKKNTHQPADATIIGPRGDVTTIDRSIGADGRVDSRIAGPRGGVTSVDRYAVPGNTTNARVTGPNGGVTSVDRTRDANGLVDRTTTGPRGNQWRVDRSRGADGAIDTVRISPRGTTIIDRSR
jgi:hypothetical protein